MLQDLSKLQGTGAEQGGGLEFEGGGAALGCSSGPKGCAGAQLAHFKSAQKKKKRRRRNMSFKSKNYNLKVNLHSLQLGKRPGKSLEIKLFQGKTFGEGS